MAEIADVSDLSQVLIFLKKGLEVVGCGLGGAGGGAEDDFYDSS